MSTPPPPPPPPLPPAGSPLFKSNDSGATWTALIKGLSCRLVDALAADPKSPNVIYAGTDRGVFKTTNGGDDWTPFNTGAMALFSVNSLAVDPVNTSTVYAAGSSYKGAGMLKSDDAGLNWKVVLSVSQGLINYFEIDPNNHNTLYAIDDFNLYKSKNGGKKWSKVLSLPPSQNVYESNFRIDPLDSSIIYVIADKRLFKTTNGGSSWNDITDRALSPSANDHASSLRFDPINPSTLYLTSANKLQKTTDGGATWQDASDDHSRRINNFLRGRDTAALPVIYGTEFVSPWFAITKSIDSGNSWGVTGLLPINFLGFLIDPINPSTIYVGSLTGQAPTDTPWIRGFSFAGKTVYVAGEFFDEGAVILLNGKEQHTEPDSQAPGFIIIGKNAGKKIKHNPEIKVQIRNSNGKLSQEVRVMPPFD